MSTPTGLVAISSSEARAAIQQAGHGNPMLGFDQAAATGLPADRLCSAVEGDDRAARELVSAVGAWAGTQERRVAGSLVVLGYAARLVGATLAVMQREGIALDARPAQVRYRYRPGLGFGLTLPHPDGWRGQPDAVRARWCRDIVDDHLSGLVATVRAVAPVASGLLWGNVASGLAGALRTLAHDGLPVAACHATGLALLEYGPLRLAGELTVHDGQLRFTRRSCCLYYRLDGGGMCGDCPLPRSS